jgi:hypothetical protein
MTVISQKERAGSSPPETRTESGLEARLTVERALSRAAHGSQAVFITGLTGSRRWSVGQGCVSCCPKTLPEPSSSLYFPSGICTRNDLRVHPRAALLCPPGVGASVQPPGTWVLGNHVLSGSGLSPALTVTESTPASKSVPDVGTLTVLRPQQLVTGR